MAGRRWLAWRRIGRWRIKRMKIAGVASAFPSHRYQQQQLTDALADHWGTRLEAPELFRRIHCRAGVEVRHLAFSLEHYGQFQTRSEERRVGKECRSRMAWYRLE